MRSRFDVLDAERLSEDLFGSKDISYNKDIIPTVAGKSLEVEIQVDLTDIANFDSINQAISANMWLRLVWYDSRLVWDPEKYRGVENLKVSPENIWKPDLTLYNAADGHYRLEGF